MRPEGERRENKTINHEPALCYHSRSRYGFKRSEDRVTHAHDGDEAEGGNQAPQ